MIAQSTPMPESWLEFLERVEAAGDAAGAELARLALDIDSAREYLDRLETFGERVAASLPPVERLELEIITLHMRQYLSRSDDEIESLIANLGLLREFPGRVTAIMCEDSNA